MIPTSPKAWRLIEHAVEKSAEGFESAIYTVSDGAQTFVVTCTGRPPLRTADVTDAWRAALAFVVRAATGNLPDYARDATAAEAPGGVGHA